MKRKVCLFLALTLMILCCLPLTAFAEGTDGTPTPEASPIPTATTTPPSASPSPEATNPAAQTTAPTTAPTTTPTSVVDQLHIDSTHLYDGMDKTYAQGYVPTVKNGSTTIILPLIGQTYDGKVTITADLGAASGSPFVFGNYSQVANGGSPYVFALTIPLAPGRINGAYPVILNADYLDISGMRTTQSFTVYVTITDGKTPVNPNAPGASGKETVKKPELFISSCAISPDTVGGNEAFSVSLTIENIGEIHARSVRLTYGGVAADGASAGIIPVEANNAIHLKNIASEASDTATFKLITTKDVIAGNQPFYVTLDYVDRYGGVYTATRQFLVKVTQPAEMTYDAISLPKSVTAGETFTLPANVFNIGKSPLRNVTVNLSGAGLYPTSSVFLGDIQPGQAGYGEMKVFVGMLSMTEGYTESYGKTTGVYTVTYTDDAGETHTAEQQLSTEIKQPVIAGEKTDAEKKAEEEQKRAMSQWWISALAAFAAISIVVAVIVVSRFARMMKMK